MNKNAPDAAFLQKLTKLRALQIVQLQNAPVTNDWLKELSDQPVAVLHLIGCPKLTDEAVPHLLAISNLTELDLAGAQLTSKGASQLARLRLKLLGLNGCGKIDDKSIDALMWTKPTNQGKRELTPLAESLQKLWLEHTSVTDNCLKVLVELDTLSELNLKRTVVTKGGASSLTAKLKPCAVEWVPR